MGSNLAYDAWKLEFFEIAFLGQPIIFLESPRHEKVIRPKFYIKIVARSDALNF